MPKIDYVRPEVSLQLAKWNLIRDCLSGQEAVKAASTAYLPMPNAHDQSNENRARYAGYVQRALFLNATANTRDGMLGQVFSADPVVELPEQMRLLEEDADGCGVTLTQLAKKTLGDTLGFGRTGLLVDFPEQPVDTEGNPRAFTRAEVQDGVARPTIAQFAPTDVINWRTRLVGAKSVLSLVVIRMSYVAMDDGFELKQDDEWRVLRLTAAGEYVAEVWRKNEDPQSRALEPFVLHKTFEPRDANGQRLTYIPFTFVGSLNNNEAPDKPPMYDIACVNIAHYRNSADYEDSVYMVGQPTPVLTGLTKDWVDNVLKKKIQLGSRTAIPLPSNADMKLVAATENGLVKEAMESKERQLVALGAQLVEQKEVQRTLGEAKMERATVTSVLVQCAKNTAAAVQQALRWCAAFYGENPEAISYVLSTDFAISKMSPEERKQLLTEWQGGIVSFTEAREQLRQSGVAFLDDAAAKTEIDLEAEQRMNMEVEREGAIAGVTNDDPNADE
jgi:hypothetical protein